MTENFQRRFASALMMSPWLWWTGLFLLLALGPTSLVLSQEPTTPGQYFSSMGDAVADADEARTGPLFSDQMTGRSGQALGAQFRAGYLTGPGFGRDKGLAHLDLMPYAFVDTGMFFLDLRGFRGDGGQYGMNTGGGYRQYIEPLDRIFGVNFYHDYDNTSGALFRQWGFGIETYGQQWDARANAYFPYGDKAAFLGADLVDGSQRFEEHRLLYDVVNRFALVVQGVDAEIGVPIPGTWAERHDIRVYAGGYHYDSDRTGEFAGWSGRLQGNPIPSIQLQLMVTNDPEFDTNVVFAANFTFGGFRQADEERQTQFGRMTTPVQRNYNIAVSLRDVLVEDVVAVNPVTGNEYFFKHVASYAPAGGDGTFENPFQIIAETLPNTPGDDIVFVHADSVYDGSIAPDDNIVQLEPGDSPQLLVRYLGDGPGVVHQINVVGLGFINLPQGQTGDPNNTGDRSRPMFLNGIGDGVTMASFAEFSGFLVGDPDTPGTGPTGNGLFGENGVTGTILSQNVFAYAGLNGAHLDNVGSGIEISDTLILDPDGIGMLVENGTPGILFNDNDNSQILDGSQITKTAGVTGTTGNIALLVRNTLDGSTVELSESLITSLDSTAEAILISNVAGLVTIDDATIARPASFGIEIINLSGTFNANGVIGIESPGDHGIDITNLADTGQVFFASDSAGGSVTISNRNQAGINIFNIIGDGLVRFLGDVDINDVASGTAAAINWQNNAGTVEFNTITIDDTGGDAFALGTVVGNSGDFRVAGAVGIGGDTLGIAGVGVHITNNTGSVFFQDDVTINQRFNQGVFVHDNDGEVSFGETTQITNENVSILPAIDIQNNTQTVEFDRIDILAATSGGDDTYGAGVNIVNNPAQVVIDDADIESFDGIALFAFNAVHPDPDIAGLQISQGTITAVGLPAVDIQESSINITLTSVSADASAREGILLLNNVGVSDQFTFTVTGDTNQPGTGGTITGSVEEGIEATNTGSLSFSNMILTGNQIGIYSELNEELQLFNNQISASDEDGLFALNTLIVNIQGDLDANIVNFDSNGTDTELHHEVNLRATAAVPDGFDGYRWTLDQNTIIHSIGNAAVLATNRNLGPPPQNFSNAANGETLIFSETNDTIQVLAGTPLVDADGNIITDNFRSASGTTIDWSGNISGPNRDGFAIIDLNTYLLAENNSYGIVFNAPSTSTAFTANVAIRSNRITGDVGNSTAINVNAGGLANVAIGQRAGVSFGNIITLDDSGDTSIFPNVGIRFDTLGQNSTVDIRDVNFGADPLLNEGTIISDNAVAIFFNRINAPATVTIANNTFNMEPATVNGVVTGIAFNTIIGDPVTIGGANNIINTFTTAFLNPFLPISDPNDVFDGTITVNGIGYPQ